MISKASSPSTIRPGPIFSRRWPNPTPPCCPSTQSKGALAVGAAGHRRVGDGSRRAAHRWHRRRPRLGASVRRRQRALASIAEANGLGGSVSAPPGELVVGHDVLGGLFAIDGGALGVAPGEVCYFGPDTLTWDGLGGGYSAFLLAALGGLAGRGGVLGAEPGHLSLPSAVHRPGRWREQGDEVGRQYPGAAGHCVIRGSVQRIGPTPFEVPCDGILRLDPDPGDLPRTRGSAAVAAST